VVGRYRQEFAAREEGLRTVLAHVDHLRVVVNDQEISYAVGRAARHLVAAVDPRRGLDNHSVDRNIRDVIERNSPPDDAAKVTVIVSRLRARRGAQDTRPVLETYEKVRRRED
jgi:hypothetical protein